MIPLSIFGNVELIHEKYSSVLVNEVVLNSLRIGHQRRIGALSSGIIQRRINSTSTTRYFRQLTFQESPWLECTTIRKIAGIQLEVQDEYGERLKSSTTSDLPLNVTISFADVPDNV